MADKTKDFYAEFMKAQSLYAEPRPPSTTNTPLDLLMMPYSQNFASSGTALPPFSGLASPLTTGQSVLPNYGMPISASIDKSNPFLCSAFGENSIKFDQLLSKSNGAVKGLDDVMLADNMPLILKPPLSSTPSTSSQPATPPPHSAPPSTSSSQPVAQFDLFRHQTPSPFSTLKPPIAPTPPISTPPISESIKHSAFPSPSKMTSPMMPPQKTHFTPPKVPSPPAVGSPSKVTSADEDASCIPKKRKRKNKVTQKVIKCESGSIYSGLMDTNGTSPSIPVPTYFGNTPPLRSFVSPVESSMPTPPPPPLSLTPVNLPRPLSTTSTQEEDSCILDLSMSKPKEITSKPSSVITSATASPMTSDPNYMAAMTAPHIIPAGGPPMNDVQTMVTMMQQLQAFSSMSAPGNADFMQIMSNQLKMTGFSDDDIKCYQELMMNYAGMQQQLNSQMPSLPAKMEQAPKPRRKRVAKHISSPIPSKSQQMLRTHLSSKNIDISAKNIDLSTKHLDLTTDTSDRHTNGTPSTASSGEQINGTDRLLDSGEENLTNGDYENGININDSLSGIRNHKRSDNMMKLPLDLGWQRITYLQKNGQNQLIGKEVIYHSLDGVIIRNYPQVENYLVKNNISNLSSANFSFNVSISLGIFVQKDNDSSTERILTSEEINEFCSPLNEKDYAISMQSLSEMKNRKKEDKQMEKERAKKLKEIQTRDKKKREQEFKIQELNEKRFQEQKLKDYERERKKNELLNLKLQENQRKIENKERVKELKKQQLQKKKEQRIYDSLLNEELSKPIEDMRIILRKDLPDLEKLKIQLSSTAFGHCLFILEFVNSFHSVLHLDFHAEIKLKTLQLGFLCVEKERHIVVKLLHHLIFFVIGDPLTKLRLKDALMLTHQKLVNLKKGSLNCLSEILRVYFSHGTEKGHKQVYEKLEKCTFLNLTPEIKGEIFECIIHDILGCQSIIKAIDKDLDIGNALRKEKWVIEARQKRLKQLRLKKQQLASYLPNNSTMNDLQDPSRVKTENIDVDPLLNQSGIKFESKDDDAIEIKEESHESGDEKIDIPTKEDMDENEVLVKLLKAEDEKLEKMDEEEIEEAIVKGKQDEEDHIKNVSKAFLNLRARTYGRDRYDRRYWCLRYAGGVYIEGGMSSCDVPVEQPSSQSQQSPQNEDVLMLDVTNTCQVAPLSTDNAPDFLTTPLIKPSWLTACQNNGHDLTPCDLDGKLSGKPMSEDEDDDEGCYGDTGDADCNNDNLEEAKLVEIIKSRVDSDINTNYTLKISADIPEDKRDGWWLERDGQNIKELMKSMSTRGVQESELQKKLTFHWDELSLSCSHKLQEEMKDILELDNSEEVSVKFNCLADFNDELTKLENRVLNANLQKKAWMLPKAIKLATESVDNLTKLRSSDIDTLTIDQFKERILKLESNIERRYFLEPFGRSVELSLKEIEDDKTGVTKTSIVENECELSNDLLQWRKCIEVATDESQLSLAIQMLSEVLAWERSIMKVKCEVCNGDDHEEMLLLCDRCELGYHLYCIKPGFSEVPEDDWYCYDCDPRTTNVDRMCFTCGTSGTSKNSVKCFNCNRYVHLGCMLPPALRMPRKWQCCKCDSTIVKCEERRIQKKKRRCTKSSRRISAENEEEKEVSEEEVPALEIVANDDKMLPCGELLTRMFGHTLSTPFHNPVNEARNPEYRKFINKPMDFSTIKVKLKSKIYKSKKQFIKDFRLIFENCKVYNEDTSDIGVAGNTLSEILELEILKL